MPNHTLSLDDAGVAVDSDVVSGWARADGVSTLVQVSLAAVTPEICHGDVHVVVGTEHGTCKTQQLYVSVGERNEHILNIMYCQLFHCNT